MRYIHSAKKRGKDRRDVKIRDSIFEVLIWAAKYVLVCVPAQ